MPIQEKEEGIRQDNQKVPKCLLDIVGKTMDFQVKIADYNFTASFQTFTVTRITKANSILQAKDDAITTKVMFINPSSTLCNDCNINPII